MRVVIDLEFRDEIDWTEELKAELTANIERMLQGELDSGQITPDGAESCVETYNVELVPTDQLLTPAQKSLWDGIVRHEVRGRNAEYREFLGKIDDIVSRYCGGVILTVRPTRADFDNPENLRSKYLVAIDPRVQPQDYRRTALDVFHSNVPVKDLEGYYFRVYLGEQELDQPDSDGEEPYAMANMGVMVE